MPNATTWLERLIVKNQEVVGSNPNHPQGCSSVKRRFKFLSPCKKLYVDFSLMVKQRTVTASDASSILVGPPKF